MRDVAGGSASHHWPSTAFPAKFRVQPPPVKPPYHTKVFLCVRRGKGLVVVIGMEGVHAEIESGQPTVWTVKGDTEPEQEQETEQK